MIHYDLVEISYLNRTWCCDDFSSERFNTFKNLADAVFVARRYEIITIQQTVFDAAGRDVYKVLCKYESDR